MLVLTREKIMNIKSEGNDGGNHGEIFDLEEIHDEELLPLIRQLCDKAQAAGIPIFVVSCYKTDSGGAWLASSARARGEFAPKEFYLIRAVVEGTVEIIDVGKVMEDTAKKIAKQ